MTDRLVYLDTETTGLNPMIHDAWEVAWAVDDGPVLTTLLGHGLATADPTALAINQYYARTADKLVRIDRFDRKDYRYYPKETRESELHEALHGATIVGANPAFDAAFLQQRWGCWGNAPWKYRMLDIESYAAAVFDLEVPIGLGNIAARLGIDQAAAHTADDDVLVLRECHLKLREIARR